MGRDKAFVTVGGRPMLERLLEVGRSACSGCVLVADDPPRYAGALVRWGWEDAAPRASGRPPRGPAGGGDRPDAGEDPPAEHRFLRAGTPLRLTTDRRPGLGPVAGLEAGLGAAAGPLCFVAACDLPFLDAPVVRALLGELDDFVGDGASPGRGPGSAVVPVAGGAPQPLAAAYSSTAAGAAARCLDEGARRMDDLLRRLEVRTVAAEELGEGADARPAAASERPFTNVNRTEDLAAARREAASDGDGDGGP